MIGSVKRDILLEEAAAHPLVQQTLAHATQEHGLMGMPRPAGQGGSGVIFRVTNAQGKVMALKIPNYGRWPADAHVSLRKKILKEALRLKLVSSAVVPRLLYSDEQGEYLVREFIDGTPLSRLRKQVQGEAMANCVHNVLACTRQLFADFHENADQSYVSLDVKEDNFIHGEQEVLPIFFVDIASIRPEHASLSRIKIHKPGTGKNRHFPPEKLLEEAGMVTRALDYFSLGTLIHQLVVGSMPYSNTEKDPDRVLETYLTEYAVAKQQALTVMPNRGLSPEVIDFVVRCLHPIADERPRRFLQAEALPVGAHRWKASTVTDAAAKGLLGFSGKWSIPLEEAAAHPLVQQTLAQAMQEQGLIGTPRPAGHGGGGVVFRVAKASGEGIALKVPNYARYPEERHAGLRERLLLEARLLRVVQSKIVPRLLYCQEHSAYLMREFVEGIPLDRLIGQVPEESLGALINSLLACARQLFTDYHENPGEPYVLRDIRPQNIIGREAGGWSFAYVDIGGIQKERKAGGRRGGGSLGTGKSLSRSPEYLLYGSRGSRKDGALTVDRRTDYFSLGIIIYQLVVGSMPYSNTEKDPDRVLETYLTEYAVAKQQALTVMPNRGLSPEVIDFVVRCLHPIADERPRRFLQAEALPVGAHRWKASTVTDAAAKGLLGFSSIRLGLEEAAAHPRVQQTLARAIADHGFIDTPHPVGQGCVGIVYRVTNAAGEVMALKIPNYARWPAAAHANLYRKMLKEARLLSVSPSAGVPRLRYCEERGTYLLREFVEGQPLHLLRRQMRTEALGKLVRDFLVFVRHLFADYHDNPGEPFVLRDVKPQNFIGRAGDDWTFVYIDIDSINVERKVKGLIGKPRELGSGVRTYHSPEYLMAINERGLVDRRTDYFAMGAVIYFLVTGEAPYSNKEPNRDLALAAYMAEYPNVAQQVQTTMKNLGLSPEVIDFVVRCLHPIAAQRPVRFIELPKAPRWGRHLSWIRQRLKRD